MIPGMHVIDTQSEGRAAVRYELQLWSITKGPGTALRYSVSQASCPYLAIGKVTSHQNETIHVSSFKYTRYQVLVPGTDCLMVLAHRRKRPSDVYLVGERGHTDFSRLVTVVLEPLY